MKNYTIIDNALSEENFGRIEQLLTGPNFPWFFQNTVAEFGQENLPDYYFTHQIFRKDTNYASPSMNFFEPVLEKLNIHDLIRIKANLYPNVGSKIQNKPHVDYPFQCKGAILYVNTNNGFTILNDETKVESVRNRLLIFNSELPHSSTYCTDKKVRLNINFNYIGNNNE